MGLIKTLRMVYTNSAGALGGASASFDISELDWSEIVRRVIGTPHFQGDTALDLQISMHSMFNRTSRDKTLHLASKEFQTQHHRPALLFRLEMDRIF